MPCISSAKPRISPPLEHGSTLRRTVRLDTFTCPVPPLTNIFINISNTTYTGNSDGTATLHVSQLPPNPAILAPGPAFIYVVVNGIPSVGQMIMVGSGKIAKQPTTLPADLPVSSVPPAANNGTDTGGGVGGSGDGGSKVKNSATSVAGMSRWHLGIVGLGLFVVSCL